MSLIINPGSGGTELSGDGWTNSVGVACKHAEEWLSRMHAEGLREVTIVQELREFNNGRWTFYFRHELTGAMETLETHGIDNMDAYMQGRCAYPWVYWNGSSTDEPKLEDFAADGWTPLLTFTQKENNDND